MEYHSTLKKRMKSCHLQQVKGKQILHGMTYMWNVECGKQKKQTQQNPSKTYTLLFHLNLVLPFLETVLWKFLLWSKGSSLDRSVGKAHRSCLNLHCLRTNTLSPPPTVQWFPRLRSRQMAHGNRLMFHLENDLLILSLFSPPPTII